MIMKHLRLLLFSFAAVAAFAVCAQRQVRINLQKPTAAPPQQPEQQQLSVSDSLLQVYESSLYDLFDQPLTLPPVFFMPAVYSTFEFDNPLAIGDTIHSGNPALRWVEDAAVLSRQATSMRHHLFYQHPELVRYNLATLPVAPQQYVATVNPSDFTITPIPAAEMKVEDPRRSVPKLRALRSRSSSSLRRLNEETLYL